MMRLMGVLVGSALAVIALVVFVGKPEFTTTTSVTEEPVITLPIRPEVVAESEQTLAPPPPALVEKTDQASDEVPEDSDGIPGDEIDNPPVIEEPEPLETMQQWYAFWSPFRSEIAATGFVDQLQRVTGLDYRVVKIKPGVYEVAFAYQSDDEITANLSQISAATGLNLPES
jgi:hypothetical protein